MKTKPQKRKIFDNIHGFIQFDQNIWKFIDTPEFQKLRNIKQLGCLSYVFPGATHTRFQHCLGTGHLAKTFILQLMENSRQFYKNCTDIQIKQAVFTVTLAGIMHDVGHGPFSHTFDNQVVKTKIYEQNSDKLNQKWSHQIGSQVIFQQIVRKLVQKQNINEIIPGNDYQRVVKRIIKLIRGKKDENDQRPWEFQLISNKQTGIDVDKLDYFRRDAYYLGAKGIQINHQLLMKQARILKNQKEQGTICYPSKYAIQVNDIFFSRYKLYKTYYLNNKSKGIQFMILDILNYVEPIFKFEQICKNIRKGSDRIKQYVSLNDNILDRIQYMDITGQIFTQKPLLLKNLNDAKILLNKMKQRKIYKFVRQVHSSISQKILDNEQNRQDLQKIFNVQNIKQFILKAVQDDRIKNQFHIAVTDIGYGKKQYNPLKKVNFFRKQDPNKRILSKQEFRNQNISILYTQAFVQRYAKLFVVDDITRANSCKINTAFQQYFRQRIQNNVIIQDKNLQIVLNHFNLGTTHFISTQIQQDFQELNQNFNNQQQQIPQ